MHVSYKQLRITVAILIAIHVCGQLAVRMQLWHVAALLYSMCGVQVWLHCDGW